MTRKTTRHKGTLARFLVAMLLIQTVAGTSSAAISIPVGIDLSTVLASIAPTIDTANTFLALWRTGTPNQAPTKTTSMTFSYFQSGTSLPLPSRSNPKDNTANNQNDLWSDNAIQLTYTAGNSPNSAILIYTNNAANDANDPINNVSLRGGYVGGNGSGNPDDPARSSVLPLIWKAVSQADLMAVSNANINGSVPIPSSGAGSDVYMPTEITSPTGGACPAEGPYGASTRPNNGFCDYSTHYTIDQNNTDPNNEWYTKYTKGSSKYIGSFNYASVVGAYGVDTQESGLGNGKFNPAYVLLGMSAANAISTKYGTTIFVDVLSQ